MSTREYYHAYYRSAAGQAAQAKFRASPKRKLYAAAWNEKHAVEIKQYQRGYYNKITKPQLAAKKRAVVIIERNCASIACDGTFKASATDTRRKYCGACQYALGYAATERWRFRKNHEDIVFRVPKKRR